MEPGFHSIPSLRMIDKRLTPVHSRFDSPEPHILLFRRPLGTDPQSGLVDPELERASREEYKNQFGISRK